MQLPDLRQGNVNICMERFAAGHWLVLCFCEWHVCSHCNLSRINRGENVSEGISKEEKDWENLADLKGL